MPPNQGYTLDCSDETYRSLLVRAVKDCDVQSYWVYLANGADPLRRFLIPTPDREDDEWYDAYNYDDYDGYYDDYEGCRLIPKEEDTLLYLASKSGCAEIVDHLLRQGEDPEHRGASRLTALEAWASSRQSNQEHCNWELVGELLLQAGCNPKANRGQVWKIAKGQEDGRARNILIGWKSKTQRDELAERLEHIPLPVQEEVPAKVRGRL